MTHLEAERRYQYATQKLIDLKWWLWGLTFAAPADSRVRSELRRLGGETQTAIDNLLSEDFVYDPSTFNTRIPAPSQAQPGGGAPQAKQETRS